MSLAGLAHGAPKTLEIVPGEKAINSPYAPLRFQASLDGVRAIALLMMLVVHCALFKPSGPWTAVATQLVNTLWFCMDIFFALSGYLITRILLGSDGSSRQYQNFFARRALRIVPAYVLTLLFIFFVVPNFVTPQQAIQPGERPFFVLYLQNWLFANELRTFRGVDHLWSVAVEEQFYLAWALVMMWSPRRLFPVICAAFVATAVALKLGALVADIPGIYIYWGTPTRMDAFALGSWVGWRRSNRLPGLGPGASYAVMMSALAVIALQKFFWATWLTVNTAVVTTTIAGAVFGAAWIDRLTQDSELGIRHRWLEVSGLQWLATRSYAIYLIHYPLFPLVAYAMALALPDLHEGGNLHRLVNGLVAVAIALVLSEWIHRWIEKPALSLKRYFQDERAPARASPEAA
ncbi:MAG: acyltransferase [Stagnimonas sp.]|nr:acyltransferase [Stagnimonas sp.]